MLGSNELVGLVTGTGGLYLLFGRLLVARPSAIKNTIGWSQVNLVARYFLFEVVVYYLFYCNCFCLFKYVHGLLFASVLEYGSAPLVREEVDWGLGVT